jgi:hypothetical protein
MRAFLDLFARELARREHNLWRDTAESEYAFTTIGLFPRPDADPEKFFILGLLCGKALAMNTTLPLPLSEQFFRFIDGERLTVADMDEAFATSLAAKHDLIILDIPFSYPRIDDLLLVENGSEIVVSEQNYDQYLRLIEEFTCGSKLANVRKHFLRGLFSVIDSRIWNLFSAAEKVVLISGKMKRSR